MINLKTSQSLFHTKKTPKVTYYIVEDFYSEDYSLYKEAYEEGFQRDEEEKPVVKLLNTDSNPLSLLKLSEFDLEFYQEHPLLSNSNDYSYSKAKSLPDGWYWKHYKDGSGHLLSPQLKEYFHYNICPNNYGYYEINYEDLDGKDDWEGFRLDGKDGGFQEAWTSFYSKTESKIINMLKSPNQDNKNSNPTVEANIEI